MRKAVLSLCVVLLLTLAAGAVMAKPGNNGQGNNAKDECVSIQEGELTYSEGHYLEDEPLTTGFDAYGYNYQAHMFKGSFANVYLGDAGYPPYEGNDEAYLEENPGAEDHWAWPSRDIELIMKWNDAWLSNKDCDGDGKLDRHYCHEGYIGSGAWLTNHMRWSDGNTTETSFTKIVAVPADAEKNDSMWYTADGSEIGPVIWGSFAIIQEVESGEGATYVSPTSAGFGFYK